MNPERVLTAELALCALLISLSPGMPTYALILGFLTLTGALLVSASVSIAMTRAIVEDLKAGRDVLVTAHRVSSIQAPENPLSSIRQAIEDDADFAKIRDLDAGSWFSDAFADERIPTLEQTIDLANCRMPNCCCFPSVHG